jgi:hypothetical protein
MCLSEEQLEKEFKTFFGKNNPDLLFCHTLDEFKVGVDNTLGHYFIK